MRTHKLILRVAAIALLTCPTIHTAIAQEGGFNNGCCIPEPEVLIAWREEVAIAAFECCCNYGTECSSSITVSGGRAVYSGYTTSYRCGESVEDCEEAKALYDERHRQDAGDLTNFPPVPCEEQGFFTQASFEPGQIWADGDQICEHCCEEQGDHTDCAPQPEETFLRTDSFICGCCF